MTEAHSHSHFRPDSATTSFRVRLKKKFFVFWNFLDLGIKKGCNPPCTCEETEAHRGWVACPGEATETGQQPHIPQGRTITALCLLHPGFGLQHDRPRPSPQAGRTEPRRLPVPSLTAQRQTRTTVNTCSRRPAGRMCPSPGPACRPRS